MLQNKLTYLVGVFDNDDIGTSPLFSGRVRLALLDTEPGFWGNASFFGDKNMLSVGVGGQFQKHGSTTPATTTTAAVDKDYSEVNADVLLEKKIPGGGWFTAEGAYYHYNVNDGGLSDSAYILAAFATGPVGVGNVQPMARFQYFKLKGDGQPKPLNFDAGISLPGQGPRASGPRDVQLHQVRHGHHCQLDPARRAGDLLLMRLATITVGALFKRELPHPSN